MTSIDWSACVAVLVIEYHQPMKDAWDMTYREYCLLHDVKNEIRTIAKQSRHYDADRVAGLEEHLRNMGVSV